MNPPQPRLTQAARHDELDANLATHPVVIRMALVGIVTRLLSLRILPVWRG